MLIHRSTGQLLRRAVATTAAALVLVTAGCSGSDDESGSGSGDGAGPDAASTPSTTTDPDVTILQPGRPGESASTLGPDDIPEDAEWNHADVAFMQMMIPHHAQALEMADLANERARSREVTSLARRIAGAQGPEIITMAAWLEQRNIDVPREGEDAEDFDHSEHGHSGMTGMLTPEQMTALAEAKGRRFDRLFLEGMIDHHQGAVDMANEVGTTGSDLQVAEMAADVATGQAAEIRRMRELLRDL